MNEKPVELDTRRGITAQTATALRRVLAEAEAQATILRTRQSEIETNLRDTPATNWPEAAAKARYVLKLYEASLGDQDSMHRDLVASVLNDFKRLDH